MRENPIDNMIMTAIARIPVRAPSELMWEFTKGAGRAEIRNLVR